MRGSFISPIEVDDDLDGDAIDEVHDFGSSMTNLRLNGDLLIELKPNQQI